MQGNLKGQKERRKVTTPKSETKTPLLIPDFHVKKPDELRDALIEYIRTHPNAIYIEDACNGLGMTSRTFRNYFHEGDESYGAIMQALDSNIITTKSCIRDKFFNSNMPASLIALYKLIGTQEEREALSNTIVRKDKEQKQEIILKIE